MRYHNITKDDMLNGDGLRVVLWVSGCDHRCRECHNPITWNPESGLVFDREAKNEIFTELKKDYISGLTLSGGDPLFWENQKEITDLTMEVKHRFPDKTIWLYTGAVWETVRELPVMQYVDVCVDGEFIIDQKDPKLLWKGSRNQRVIDVKATLKEKGAVLPVLYCADYEIDYEEELKERERASCEG